MGFHGRLVIIFKMGKFEVGDKVIVTDNKNLYFGFLGKIVEKAESDTVMYRVDFVNMMKYSLPFVYWFFESDLELLE